MPVVMAKGEQVRRAGRTAARSTRCAPASAAAADAWIRTVIGEPATCTPFADLLQAIERPGRAREHDPRTTRRRRHPAHRPGDPAGHQPT
ncbi:MAG: hypothetical protein HOZ81_18035 [Streptomyces sp.]|nr:hypothetical protein [Streptomyces sp.]